MITTLYRIGDRVFSLAYAQEIDLAYDPRRYDRDKPPAREPGVEVILISGERVKPFFGPEADVLRRYLAGEPVEADVVAVDGATTVIRLVPAAGVEPVTAVGPGPILTAWGSVDGPIVPRGCMP
jgi:hypothetical protein